MCDGLMKRVQQLEERVAELETHGTLSTIADSLQEQKANCPNCQDEIRHNPAHAMQERFNCPIEKISFYIEEDLDPPSGVVEILLASTADIKILREHLFIFYDYMGVICKELFRSQVVRSVCGYNTSVRVKIKKRCDDGGALAQLVEYFVVNV